MKPIRYTGNNEVEILNAISHPQGSVRCQLGVLWLNGVPANEGDWICQIDGHAHVIRDQDWHLIEDRVNRLVEIQEAYYPELRKLTDMMSRYERAMCDGYRQTDPALELGERQP